MTMQITLRKDYFLPLCCQSPPHLGIEVLGEWDQESKQAQPAGVDTERSGYAKMSPVKQEDLDTFSSICLSPECPAAGCAWLGSYVGACSLQGALAASMPFQANGRTLRGSILGPIIDGSISLMARETASLAPFHWFRPTEGSLDSQPMLSHQPTGVGSAAGSCFPLRLMGSPVVRAALSPHCYPSLKTFAMKHRRHEQWDLIEAAWLKVGMLGAKSHAQGHLLQVSAGEPTQGEKKQVELVWVGTAGMELRTDSDR